MYAVSNCFTYRDRMPLYSFISIVLLEDPRPNYIILLKEMNVISLALIFMNTVCPRSSDPFNLITYYIKWVTTS